MKANAPEKLYLLSNGLISYCRNNDEDIEYIHKDALIEKAVEYIKEHKEDIETEDNGIAGWIPDCFIEGFRNYLKGEEV